MHALAFNVMIIGSVDVAVIQLFAGRIAYFLDGNIEMQRDAGEGMISVDGHVVRIHPDYRHYPRP